MGTCKLWIQNADWHTTVRADRILALRVIVQPAGGATYGPFHLEAVTSDSLGENGSTAARLCSGKMENFPDDVPGQLAQLIARHIDDPEGGIISCCHEDTAQDPSIGGMFHFRSFNNHSGPRRLK